MLRRLRVLFVFYIACIATDIRADSDAVSFDEVYRSAMVHSPSTSEIAERAALARAEGVAAVARDNPELGMEVRPYLSSHGDRETEYEVEISRRLRLTGSAERARLRALIDEHATVEEKTSLFELSQTLRLSYGKAWVLQERERRTQESLQRADRLHGKVEDLMRRGAAVQSDSRLLSAERHRLGAELVGVRADRKRALAELTRNSGMSLRNRTLLPLEVGSLPAEPGGAALPPLERARLGAKLASAQAELARLDAYPKLAPRLGFEHTSDGDDRINLGVQIELPIFNRNEAGLLESTAKHDRRRDVEAYYDSDAFRDEARLLHEAAAASIEQSEILGSRVLPELREAFAASEKEFAAGQGSPVQMWQTLSALNNAQERYLELLTKALSERVELSILLGKDL